MNFVEQSFTIAQINKDGIPSSKEIEGVVAEETGLGYHYTLDETGYEIYVPTHLPSGYAMGPRFYQEDDAQAYIEQTAPLADWQNLTAKDIYEMSPDLIAQVKRVIVDVCGSDMAHRVSRIPKKQRELLKRGKAIAGAE